jgi:hypothetical protein
VTDAITKEELIEVLDQALNSRRTVDDELHRRHHEYIELELERRENRKRAWEKFRNSFIGGLAVAALGFLGWIGTLIIEWLRSGSNPG